jgi:hypothetical protein
MQQYYHRTVTNTLTAVAAPAATAAVFHNACAACWDKGSVSAEAGLF